MDNGYLLKILKKDESQPTIVVDSSYILDQLESLINMVLDENSDVRGLYVSKNIKNDKMPLNNEEYDPIALRARTGHSLINCSRAIKFARENSGVTPIGYLEAISLEMETPSETFLERARMFSRSDTIE